jgi:hypothetical protein
MKAKRYAEGGELPQDLVDRLARESNKSDKELVTKPARAVAEGVRSMYRAATGKDPKTGEKSKPFQPRTYVDFDGGHTPSETVQSPVGGKPGDGSANMRSLNMGKKSKASSTADYKKYDEERGTMTNKDFKKGGSVSSASKRGDGCAIKGKTRGRMV